MFRILTVVLVAFASVALGCTNSAISNAPYQLSMLTANAMCGASILTTQFAITSAYCVKASGTTQIKLYSGSILPLISGYVYSVVKATTHPSYSTAKYDYDLAILSVTPFFVFSAYVAPIALPVLGQATAVGTLGKVTGWSTTCGPVTSFLKVEDLPVASCAAYSAYNTIRKICVATTVTPVVTCQGDRGGPLVVNGQLIGVRSFNPSVYCATPGQPVMFTKVSMLRTWITSTMTAMG